MKNASLSELDKNLVYLKLQYVADHYAGLAKKASQEQTGHVAYLDMLMDGEAALRRQRAVKRRISQAKIPVIKTLDQFDWSWPKKINRLQIQNLFRLEMIRKKTNVIFVGGVGLGKSHLASALAYTACLKGHSVLFTTAIDAINCLSAAQSAGRLKQELRKYTKPALLVMDELGYLPIDKIGADLLFQIISYRYEQGAMAITTNRVFKDWPEIFNNDATLTSAILDRLLHHAETAVIEGSSYRMKDRIES